MGAKTHVWMPKGVRSVFGCVLGRSDLSQWFSVRVKVFKAELRVVNSGPSVVRSMEHGSYKGHSDLHRAGPKPPRTLFKLDTLRSSVFYLRAMTAFRKKHVFLHLLNASLRNIHVFEDGSGTLRVLP